MSQATEAFGSFRFIDVEASGLHDGSYPIEVAWADPRLSREGFLIRPLDHWGERDWSAESERVHNIPRRLLLREGIPARDAALRLNASLGGKRVFSDAPAFDGSWLWRLFDGAGVEPLFGLGDYNEALSLLVDDPDFPGSDGEVERLVGEVRRRYPHTHRAGDDALQMAAVWRCLCDAGWRRRIGLEG